MQRIGNRNHWQQWQQRWQSGFSVVAIYLFAGAISPSKALANLLLTLLLLLWLFQLFAGQSRWWLPEIRRWWVLCSGYLLLLLIAVGWGAHLWSSTPSITWQHHLDVALSLWRVPLAIGVIGWYIYLLDIDIEQLCYAFVVGLLVNVGYGLLTTDQVPALFNGGLRTGFLMHNPNSLGLYSAVALLILLLLPPPNRGSLVPFGVSQISRWLLWLVALIVSGLALFFSQSRSGWVAIAVVLLPLIGWLLLQQWRHHRWLFWVITLTFVTLLWLITPSLWQIFSSEQAALLAMWNGDWADAPSSSFGQRLQMWQLGITQWLHHPLVGLGPAGSAALLSQADNPILREHPNLHADLIDQLLAIGLIGVAVLYTFVFWLVQGVWRAFRSGLISLPMLLLLGGAGVIYWIDALAAFLMSRDRGFFYLALFGGMALSLTWRIAQDDSALRAQQVDDSV